MPETFERNGEPVHPDVLHEKSDANVRGILWFAGVMLVLAVLIHVGLGVVFQVLNSREDREKPPLPGLITDERNEQSKDFIPSLDQDKRRRRIEQESGQRELQPRLQSDPAEDLKIMRAWEKSELHAGKISVPEAMRLLSKQGGAKKEGVKVRRRKGSEPKKQGIAGASSSGRPVAEGER